MDCTTQRNSEMTMKDWEDYYTNAHRDPNRKLNVISLEFSFTKVNKTFAFVAFCLSITFCSVLSISH
jgi:hypothetical protein